MRVKKFGFVLFLSILCIILFGCSSDSGTTNEVEGNTNDANGEKIESGELNFAYHVQPPTLDVHFTTSYDTRDIGKQIFESLVTFDSKLEVQPMLAESYEVSEDGKEVIFNLREGVPFHNGEEMKSDDVVASMEKWQEQSSKAKNYLAVSTYEAVDDYTVVAHIDDPTTLDMLIFADIKQLAAIMPKEVVESAGADGVVEYIGTGPFKFEEWKKDQYIHLSKFADYQPRSESTDGMAGEKKALVDDLYINFVTDSSTRIAGIQSGEYDIASAIPLDNVDMLRGNEDVNIDLDMEAFTGFIFNKRAGFLSDETARKAVNAAVNVEELLIAAYGDEEFYDLDPGLMLQDQEEWYTNAGNKQYRTYDPEFAKQLLDESGYNDEEITIIVSRDHDDYYNMSVVLQEQLKAIGMNVELEVYDWSALMERRSDEDAYNIFSTNFGFEPTPIVYPFLDPEWVGWTDSEEIANLIDEIQHADSQDEAKQHVETLQEAMWEYLPIIKVGNNIEATAMSSSVNGLTRLDGVNLWNSSKAE